MDRSRPQQRGISDLIKGNKRLIAAILAAVLGIIMIAASFSSASDKSAEGDELEKQLAEMCSSLSGVGSCRVMVTYKVSESRYGSSGTKIVESVAVVCKGADKVGVRRELTDMLSALYGIGANRIHVSKMK